MNTIHYLIVTMAFLLASATNAAAQTDRNLIRQGNRAFKTQKWAAAETQYPRTRRIRRRYTTWAVPC